MTGKQTGNPEKNYFEDIFNRSIILWKEKYPLSKERDKRNKIHSLFLADQHIWWYIVEQSEEGDDERSIMSKAIYRVLTRFAASLPESENMIHVKDVPIASFEKELIALGRKQSDNPQYENFFINYDGFRDQNLKALNTGDYLSRFSLSIAVPEPSRFCFEDVFNPIIVCWKKRYYFSKRNDTDSMVCSLGKHFNEIEYEVDVNNFGKYNDWQSAMVFIIYSVATDYALNLQEKPKSFLLSDIPVATFENKLIENFKSLHNDKQFHYEYEDFIVAYKGFSNKSLSRLNLGEYLKHFSLTLN